MCVCLNFCLDFIRKILLKIVSASNFYNLYNDCMHSNIVNNPIKSKNKTEKFLRERQGFNIPLALSPINPIIKKEKKRKNKKKKFNSI